MEQEQPQPHRYEHSKRTITFARVVAGIALLILIGVVGWGMWVRQSKITEQTPTANSNSAVDTSDWKTYRNEELGIALSYPSQWQYTIYPTPVVDTLFRIFFFNGASERSPMLGLTVLRNNITVGSEIATLRARYQFVPGEDREVFTVSPRHIADLDGTIIEPFRINDTAHWSSYGIFAAPNYTVKAEAYALDSAFFTGTFKYFISQMQIDPTANPQIHPSVGRAQPQPLLSTSNWQTYRSDRVPLYFKYPREWTLEESDSDLPSSVSKMKSIFITSAQGDRMVIVTPWPGSGAESYDPIGMERIRIDGIDTTIDYSQSIVDRTRGTAFINFTTPKLPTGEIGIKYEYRITAGVDSLDVMRALLTTIKFSS